MATTETDLLESDPVLLSLIHTFSNTRAPQRATSSAGRRSGWSHPFALAGFARFRLRERFVVDEASDTLVWAVRVDDTEQTDSNGVELRYGMAVSELGYAASERARCQRRLKSLAEAHLRAHLHMFECGLTSSPTGVTLLDERGRTRSSND